MTRFSPCTYHWLNLGTLNLKLKLSYNNDNDNNYNYTFNLESPFMSPKVSSRSF